MARIALGVFIVGLAACTGQPEAAPVRVRAPESPPAHASAAPSALPRANVVATVDQGLGRFLQKVDVEPSFASGRFQGFRIVALRPASFWEGVDLKPGDVVLAVNGMPIERETQAYDAFQSLRTAPELRVDYLRDGASRALTLPIVDAAK